MHPHPLFHLWESVLLALKITLSLPRKRLQVVDFYSFKNAELPLSHLWEREPRRGGRGCSYREKHPLPNPLPPVGEGTHSGVFGSVSREEISSAKRVQVSLPQVGEGINRISF
jgi:hypothetical protein